MAKTEIKIGGFGGQGVILSGYIIGKAAAIYDGKHATMIQAFGPEARGSACSAQVIVSDEPIGYPYVKQPNILVVMSQEAYTKFTPELAQGGDPDHRRGARRPHNLRRDRHAFRHPGHPDRRGAGPEDGPQHRHDRASSPP